MTSVVLFSALALFYMAFGALYASVDGLLWFHAAAVPEGARGDVLTLYLALMKLIGASSAALGFLGVIIALGPLRGGAAWAANALALAFLAPLAMAAYVAEQLARATGAPTSFHIMAALSLIVACAFGAHALASRRGR